MASWAENSSKPLVSIICTTYNHGHFIEDAIKGFLRQQTSFSFEIWIHDDASIDCTQKIIREYKSRYPNIIKCILQSDNQYSKGNLPVLILSEKTSGKYWAMCEGDDYWINPRKLEMQIDLLEANPLINMSIHPAEQINFVTNEKKIIGRYREGSGLVPVSDVLVKKHGQIPFASTLIRYKALKRYFDFRKDNTYLKVGDIYLHFWGGEPNGICYLDNVCSVYRIFVPGSWTQNNASSQKLALCNRVARVRSYQTINKMTKGRYGEQIRGVNYKRIKSIACSRSIGISERVQLVCRNWEGLSLINKVSCIFWSLLPRLFLNLRNSIKIKNKL